MWSERCVLRTAGLDVLARRAASGGRTTTSTTRALEAAPAAAGVIATALALGGAATAATALVLTTRGIGTLAAADAALLDVQPLAVDIVRVGSDRGVVALGRLEVDEGAVLRVAADVSMDASSLRVLGLE